MDGILIDYLFCLFSSYKAGIVDRSRQERLVRIFLYSSLSVPLGFSGRMSDERQQHEATLFLKKWNSHGEEVFKNFKSEISKFETQAQCDIENMVCIYG
jgi:hypothetical protein